MSDAVFFRLSDIADKAPTLVEAVRRVRQGNSTRDTFIVNALEFRRIPGGTFGYWALDRLLRVFLSLKPFDAPRDITKMGMGTLDDFRFLRAWWEIRALDAMSCPLNEQEAITEWCVERASRDPCWVPLAKGGQFSTFYQDLHLVVDWGEGGRRLKSWVEARVGSASRKIQAQSFYFRAGITWPRRSNGLSCRILPSGAIFGDRSPSILTGIKPEAERLLALLTSSSLGALVRLQLGRADLAPSYEVGVIQQTPVPSLDDPDGERLGELAHACVDLKRDLDHSIETSHLFTLPVCLRAGPVSLAQGLTAWQGEHHYAASILSRNQTEIDAIALRLYGLTEEDIAVAPAITVVVDEDASASDEDDEEVRRDPGADAASFAASLISWAVGGVLGRFDIRIALSPTLAPVLQGPFEPLPVCSPGMLVGSDGLPATRDRIASEAWLRARPNAITLPPDGSVPNPTIQAGEYPLDVEWDGIIVDQADHSGDIVRRVRDVLHLVWGDAAEAIEREACEMLGVKELRDWFRNPRGFWEDHVHRYSRSRRKAPIYWLLQSAKRSFGLWLYYHRIDADMLAKALVNYVEPKLRLEGSRLREMRTALAGQAATGAAARRAERDIERQEALIGELQDFQTALDRAAKLGLRPDLDDGVVLNIAPLHELVAWKIARQYWDELLAGKYTWSTIADQLRAKGLVH